MPEQLEQRLGRHRPVAQVDGVVAGPVVAGDLDGGPRLVVAPVGEAHVECGGGAAGRARVRRDDERRVDASAQQRRDRHVRDRLPAHRVEQSRFDDRHRAGQLARGIGFDPELVVAAQTMALRCDRQRRGGRQGRDVGEPGRRLRDVAQAHEVVACLSIDRRAEILQRRDRLDLAGEHPLPVEPRVEQRLHAVAIARQHQAPVARIVDGEREDAAQPGDQLLAPLLVQMDQHLGIGRPPEAMPAFLELPTQRLMIVDLAVVHDVDAPILVGHRLPPGRRQIDEGEPAMHELTVLVAMAAAPIGPTMSEQGFRSGGPVRLGGQRHGVEASSKATHGARPGVAVVDGWGCRTRAGGGSGLSFCRVDG